MVDKSINNLKRGIQLEQEKQSSISLFKKKSMSSMEVRLHDKLADTLRNRDWKGCLNHRMKAVKGYSDLGEKEKSYRIRLKYAFDLHDSGKLKESLDELDDIISRLESKGIITGINACEFEKARIYEDMGKYKDAENILKSIIERSEEIDDEIALKRANSMIEKILNKMGRR